MRYFITLSYDGARYHGWQVQPNGISVEGEMERCLSVLLRQSIDITGAGRTDAGVNASMMVAHFDYPHTLDCQQLCYRLNRILPQDIAVESVKPVSDTLHARFSALSRTYHYNIHLSKNPFARRYSLEVHYPLDFKKMNEAASHLLTVSDFKSFCKTHTDVKTTICHVTKAEWKQTEMGWTFEITANRFLRNMVRAVVGTLMDVGRGRITLSDFDDIVREGNRSSAGESMPAQALFLTDIKYPEV